MNFDNKNNDKKNGLPLGNGKQGTYYAIFLLILVAIFAAILLFKPAPLEENYSTFISHVKANAVKEVTIQGYSIEVKANYLITNITPNVKKETIYNTYMPLGDRDLLPLLKSNNVIIKGKPIPDGSGMSLFFWIIILVMVLFIVWFVIARGGQNADPGRATSFGKSRARLHNDLNGKVSFADVAGCEEAKEDLVEVVDFLKDPQKYTKIGARIPKGALLIGPPGTGKTLLAKAVAGEAHVPFFSISGSEFVEMFVGVGASRVRDLFAQGRKNAPCIIFVDELDAVGRSRGAGVGGSHDEREQTLNQILVEMDGFDSSEGLIMLAATNRPDILDKALLRPGRFDRQVMVDVPDVRGREMILKIHTKKVPLSEGIDLNVIARGTPGYTGADIENLVNESALKVARENRKLLTIEDFEYAKDKISMGPERKSMLLTDEDRVLTAYHEAGHALVGHYLSLTDPVHKVTIIPRGRALGMTMALPTDEKRDWTRSQLLEKLEVNMGGRAAEDLMFGKKWASTGASQDIAQATDIARAMVCEWGMSEALGPLRYGEKEGPVFLGKDLVTRKNFSDNTHEIIDNEIKSIVETAYNNAFALIKRHEDKLDALAVALVERETLNAKDIDEILGTVEKTRYPRFEKIKNKVQHILAPGKSKKKAEKTEDTAKKDKIIEKDEKDKGTDAETKY